MAPKIIKKVLVLLHLKKKETKKDDYDANEHLESQGFYNEGLSKSDILEKSTENAEPDTAAATALVLQDAKASIFLCGSCQKCLMRVCAPHHQTLYSLAVFLLRADVSVSYNCLLHNTYQSWEDAIRASCWICCQLQEYIPAPILGGWAETRTIQNAIMYSADVYDWKPFSLAITTGGNRIDLAIRRSLDAASKTVTRDIGTTSNSTSAWNTVFKWLNDCADEHESCTKLESMMDTKWYPTRLLDLGEPTDTFRKINILETANEKLEGYYITLSHCWGEGRHLRLTNENRQALLNEVPNLSKTFAEAISASRKLGVRYLWIDSLCIIQDDTEDWAKEAALMHRIYRNAWCNIAAAASRNSSEGLFRKRKANTTGELVVDVGGIDRVGIVDKGIFVSEIDRSPLQKRAWVLQERLLSRRILHFGKSQIFWECSQLTACERFPDGLPKGINNDEIRKIFDDATSKNSTTTWNSIVKNYTNRAMTCTSDKLPALSGVANTLSAKLGGTYLAGIWNNEHLLRQLAWSTKGPVSKLRPRPSYRAPTWSWASVDDPVHFWRKPGIGFDYQPHPDLIEAHVDPMGSEETSTVKNGFLLLRGHLKRVAQSRKREFNQSFTLQFDTCEEVVGDLFFLSLFYECLWAETRVGFWDWDYSRCYLILVRDPDYPESYRRVGFATTNITNHQTGDIRADPGAAFLEDARQAILCDERFGTGEEAKHEIRIL